MKNFKNHIIENTLCENERFDRRQIIEWCLKNVDNFDITREDENDLDEQGVSDNGFRINDNMNYVEILPQTHLSINSYDHLLPSFVFVCRSDNVLIRAPHLKQLSFHKNFVFSKMYTLTIDSCDNLDFTKIDYIKKQNIRFKNIEHLIVHGFKKRTLGNITLMDCDFSNTDFSNYDNVAIVKLQLVRFPNSVIKNALHLIEEKSIKIDRLQVQSVEVYDEIITKYLRQKNKVEHVMDFTLEMIDCGYEDML